MSTRLARALRVRYRSIGVAPICNLRPDRAPRLCGFCFPLCWRCTSISAAMLIICQFRVSEFVPSQTARWVLAIALCIPTACDGILQYVFQIESTNFRRISTGVIAGIGIASLVQQVKG